MKKDVKRMLMEALSHQVLALDIQNILPHLGMVDLYGISFQKFYTVCVNFHFVGKLCLQNPDLAKKCVAALARELEISPDPTIRNNIVIILCDLCVRLDVS